MSDLDNEMFDPYLLRFQHSLQEMMKPYVELQEKLKAIVDEQKYMFPFLEQLRKETDVIKSCSLSSIVLEDTLQDALDFWNKQQSDYEIMAEQLEKQYALSGKVLLLNPGTINLWGKYGWTITQSALISDYYYVPKTKTDANKYMKRIHNSHAQKKVMEGLLNCHFHSEEDMKDALSLYRGRHYKACAISIFTLIDRLLIILQRENDQYKDKVKQGNAAIKRFKEMHQFEPDNYSVRVIRFASCAAALDAFFGNTDNMQALSDEKPINRHLLCHGMEQKTVQKIDCDQLFLLYYNLLCLIDEI